MSKRAIVAALCLCVAGPVLYARQEQAPKPAAHVTGTITYREKMALSPTAIVDVRIDDVTRPGSGEPIVASTRIEHPGQVPVRFELPYDPQLIDERSRYAVRAVISDNGMVLFASLDTVLVLTQAHGQRADLVLSRIGNGIPRPTPQGPGTAVPPLPPPPVQNLPATFTGSLPCADCEGIRYQLNLFPDDSFFARMTYLGRKVDPVDEIGSWALSSDRRMLLIKGRNEKPDMFAIPSAGVLRKLDANGEPIPGKTPYDLTRASEFRPIEVKVPVRGMYVKAGNIGAFVECSTGQLWQVSDQSPAVAELERAYFAAKPAPGGALLTDVEGVVALRPHSEDGGLRDTLTVQKFVKVQRGQCADRFVSAPLAGTFWKLTNLGGRTIPAVVDPRRQPSLTFQAPIAGAPGQYSGSSGCNRLIGTYVIVNASIELTGGGTLIACKDEAAAETAFLNALKQTRTYRIAGHTLELFDDKGVRLARFQG